MKWKLPIALMLLALGQGCVDDDRSFYIRQIQKPGSDCTVSTSASEVSWSGGVWDLSLPGYSYLVSPLVENGMNATAAEDNQPERNRIHMRGFDIKVTVEGTVALEHNVPAAGVIDPGGSSVFANVPAIPAPTASGSLGGISLAVGEQRQIFLNMRAVGDRSGDDMESAEFIFPVTLCNGCLVEILSTCPGGETEVEVQPNPCGRPQDTPVSCCDDGSGLQCYSGS